MGDVATLQKDPRKRKASKESFSYHAPDAQQVQLLGDFTRWEKAPVEMKKQKDGTWKASVALEPGRYQYRFKVDGQWRDDPHCPTRQPNTFGGANCVRQVS